MKNKEKIYIDFLGFSGSGKTTIYNSLVKEFEKDGIKAISGSVEFEKLNKIHRHVAPIFTDPFFSIKTLFLFKKFLKDKVKRNVIKYFLIDRYFFKTKKFNYYLHNGPLHYIKEADKKTLVRLLDFYPGDSLYLVFVNTPVQIIQKRREERERRKGEKKDSKRKKRENMEVLENRYKKTREFFFFLKEENPQGRVKKFIIIDGKRPVNENVEILKKEILEKIK